MAFRPGIEAEATSSGEIIVEAENLKCISCCDDTFVENQVSRSDILDFGDEGFLLHGLMSESECKHFIQHGENAGFGSIHGSSKNYRSSERLTFHSPELATLLWERLKHHLSAIVIDGDPHQQHIHGIDFLLQGQWEPHGLNGLFRLCRYLPGGHFAPHFDGHYVQTDTERSLKTLMLYLNGDFSGGSTNFINEEQELHMDEDGKYCAEEKNILYRIQPQSGMAIVFNHHRLHEGQRLESGTKYILRTDVMFQNVTPSAQSEDNCKALQLLQEAERKEASGDCMEAAKLYRQAFKLSPALEKSC